MPWPEPDPRDVKVTPGEFLSALAYRAVLISLAIILLGVLADGLSLPD
jgi:hypothetical protein